MDLESVTDLLRRQRARGVLDPTENRHLPAEALQDPDFVHRPNDRPRLKEVRVQHDADPHMGGHHRGYH